MIHIGLRNQKQSPYEVLEYIKKELPIPIDLFYKYNDKYACKHKVSFTCKICNSDKIDSWDNLNNRIKLYNVLCCKKCSYVYSTCLRENIPNELIPYYFSDHLVPFELYLKYKDYNANKLYINCNCKKCNSKTKVKWGRIKTRQHCPTEQICNKCIKKHTANLEIVRKRNSDAQLIAQNRPESKERQRIAQIKRCKENPQSIEKQRIGIKKFFNTEKGIKLKSEIIKRFKNSGHLRGYYNEIRFDSSWELSILVCYEDKNITRCNLKIPYIFNGERHTYFPDFILNDEVILEVKGRKEEINNVKMNATISYLSQNNINLKYKILYYEDLQEIDNIIFFKNIDDLSLLDKNKLKIVEYPKSWRK